MSSEVDIYQQKYLKHQKRKVLSLTSNFGTNQFKKYDKKEQETFFEILKNRSSQRTFNKEPIEIEPILKAINMAPSSCGRKGVSVRVIQERDDKDLLSGLLIGGVGWVNQADKMLFLIAEMNCYKSPAERKFMPYLDAGVIIQTVYLTCEALNYGCCFVNPNIRPENQEFFKQRFHIKENQLFCGVLVLGKYDKKHTHDTSSYSPDMDRR